MLDIYKFHEKINFDPTTWRTSKNNIQLTFDPKSLSSISYCLILGFRFFVFLHFFPKIEKLIISAIYKSVIIIFPVNLLLGFINKFCFKKLQIQPPGEPSEQHQGEVQQGMLKFKFNISNRRNFLMNLPILFILCYFVKKKNSRTSSR